MRRRQISNLTRRLRTILCTSCAPRVDLSAAPFLGLQESMCGCMDVIYWLFKYIVHPALAPPLIPSFDLFINGLFFARLPSDSLISMAMDRSCVLRGCMHCNHPPHCPEWYMVFEPLPHVLIGSIFSGPCRL